MIEKFEDRGDSAYIVEDGIASVIPKEEEYQAKLQEFNDQNMENEEIVTIDEVDTIETAPETTEIAPESDFDDEEVDLPIDEETAPEIEELTDNAPIGEDEPVDEAPEE
jgi:hypothetical protein